MLHSACASKMLSLYMMFQFTAGLQNGRTFETFKNSFYRSVENSKFKVFLVHGHFPADLNFVHSANFPA